MGLFNYAMVFYPTLGYIGCDADVTPHMDAMCSGRHLCDIDVTDIGEVSKPCRRDFTSYLEADFKCIKGILMRSYDRQIYP